jgi:uncharacterized protein DUF4131
VSALVPAAVVAAAAYALVPPSVTLIVILLAAGAGISGSAVRSTRPFAIALLVCSSCAWLGLGSRAAAGALAQQVPALPPNHVNRLSGVISGNSERTADGAQVHLRVTEIAVENLTTSSPTSTWYSRSTPAPG